MSRQKIISSKQLTEQEMEAILHKEGYESFKWMDVPGARYPKHRHAHDECIWVISGTITLIFDATETVLNAGDRLYFSAQTPHTAIVGNDSPVVYLVGQKKSKTE